MTRLDLLRAVVRQARGNGFEFRTWYVTKLGRTWQGFEEAVSTLDKDRHYYALLFSHEFVHSFWKPGVKIAYLQPKTSYTRVTRDGNVITVRRQGHMRRTSGTKVWSHHLKQMALSDEPLRYIRKFMLLEEDIVGIPLHIRMDERPITDDEEAELTEQDFLALQSTVAGTHAEMEKMDYGDDCGEIEDDEA